LAASFYCDFMKDVKSSRAAANIRGGIIVMGIFYVSMALLRRGIPWEKRFLPNLSNILVAIGAFYVWISVVSLKRLFSARKRFESYTALYQGEQLQKAIFDDPNLLQYTDEMVVKIRQNYVSQFILIGILTFIAVFFKIPLPLALYLLLIAILAGGICIFGFFGIIKWEQYYAGEGISLSPSERSKRILGMGIFSLLSIVAAILLASDKSIIPSSVLTNLSAWFFALLRPSRTFEEVAEPEPFHLMEVPPPLTALFEESAPSSIWAYLLKYSSMVLKYGFIAFVIVSFFFFLISPLLNRGKISPGRLTFFQRFIRIAAELFKGVRNGLVSFFTLLKNGGTVLRLKKHGAKEIRQAAETILSAYSQARKRDIRRSVTLFARLIIWGGEVRHIAWKPAYAPGEYCAILAATGDVHNGEIIRCGELFEQALYSAEVLSDAERQEFKDLVEAITA